MKSKTSGVFTLHTLFRTAASAKIQQTDVVLSEDIILCLSGLGMLIVVILTTHTGPSWAILAHK